MEHCSQGITAEYFEKCTGRKPENDDLEICNCPHAGELTHSMCGWNWSQDKPVFEVGSDEAE